MSAQQARRKHRSDHTFRLHPLSWSLLLACGGLPYGIQADETKIADVPLAVLQTIQPNVFITMDYSGSMTDPMTYDRNVRYRPWLFDGLLTAPHGPVRFEDADPASACNNSGETLGVGGYTANSGLDFLRTTCRYNANRINVRNTRTPPNPKPSQRTDCIASCTQANEDQNYANFVQFYSTRFKAARAAITESLGRQKYNVRVGFLPYSDSDGTTNLTGIRILDAAPLRTQTSPRYTFYRDILLRTAWGGGGTPTRPALINVGEYFRTDEPYRDNPQNAGSTLRSCRANYNILLTDGYWNNGTHAMFGTIGNADGPAGAPYQDGFGNTQNLATQGPTLADIAYYYYANDLKNLPNNVPDTVKDPAKHQHLVTYAVSMVPGDGTIPKATIDSIFDWMGRDPATRGAPPAVAWTNPLGNESNRRVDDLAHAGVNSHGGYFVANNPQQLTRAIMAALNDAIGRSTSAPVSVNNNADEPLKAGDVAYVTSYDAASWSGQLRALKIDPATGTVDFGDSAWQQSADRQLQDPGPGNSRRIVTWKGAAVSGVRGIPFKPGEILADGTTRLEDRFNLLTASDGSGVIEYLRGNRSNEGLDDANYRERDRGRDGASGTVLGDIVNSGPILNIPGTQYGDSGHTAFRTAQKSKSATVLVGANDGMMHAFDAATGKESWAYIPSFAWDCSLSGTACQPPVGGGSANPLRDSALVFGFQHRFFVDGPLLVTDVDFNNGSGAEEWHTVLTGSLGKGGRGVYALDVTDPQADNDYQAAQKVLWEFPYRESDGTIIDAAKNMGYVFDQIHMGKVRIGGSTRWVAYVPSGFNNGSATGGDGKAHLFVLDAKTGRLIKDIVAGANDAAAGSPGTPAGMAYIMPYMVDQATDHSGSVVYGGDQLGNVWRFDLTSENTSDWKAEKAAVIRADSGTLTGPQPITTPPVVAMGTDQNDKRRLFIMVGTGRYLDTADRPGNPDNSAVQNNAARQTQSFYVFKDPFQKDVDGNYPEGGATLTNLRSVLSPYEITAPGGVGTVRTFKLKNTPPANYRGFFFDLVAHDPIYERINVRFEVTAVAVVLATNAPSTDPCEQRGKGSAIIVPLVDIPSAGLVGLLNNQDPTLNIDAGYSLGSLVVTAMTIVRTEDGKLVAVLSTDAPISAADCATLRGAIPGATCTPGESVVGIPLESATPPPPKLDPRRVYWRDMSLE